MNDEGDCRTAPATPGLLIMDIILQWNIVSKKNYCRCPSHLKLDLVGPIDNRPSPE